MTKRISSGFIALTIAMFITGCHTPAGGIMPYTGGSNTYFSYETRPVTITIIDLRTNEEIFSMNVPPGKQLTFDFKEGLGDDPVYNPDLMRYEVFAMRTNSGKLRNSLTVPPANARRIDVSYRENYEYRDVTSDTQLRADQLMDRPEWWTPNGGPIPRQRITKVPDYDK